MAGIFDFFRETDDPIQRSANIPERGDTAAMPGIRLGNPGATPAKMFGSTAGKPKGLSMRSYSDLNVVSSSPKLMTAFKYPKAMDPPKAQITNFKPLSVKKSQTEMKIRSPSIKLPQHNVFKKPLTPTVKRNNKQFSYPKPEKLSYYYNEEENFLNADDRPLETDFEELIATLSRSIQTYDDEGFESDPELLTCTTPPVFSTYMQSSPETKFEDALDLPEISDDEL